MSKKLIYIVAVLFLFIAKHSFCQTTTFSEDFEAAWSSCEIPDGWSSNRSCGGSESSGYSTAWHRNDNEGNNWNFTSGDYSPGGANSTTYSARFHSYGINTSIENSAYIQTPDINMSSYSSGQLDLYYINVDGTDQLEVFFYDGSSWNSVATYTTAGSWTTKTVAIGAGYMIATFKIRIEATSDYGNTDIGVDEFVVTGNCSVNAGTASGATTICSGSTTAMSLSGQDGGTTLQWQESSDNSTWSNVSGGSGATTASYTTAALASNTYYRCAVTNGCTSYSNSQLVTVDATSNAGTSSGSTGLCADGTTVLGLSGYTGTIQWEESTDQSTWANETGGTGGTTDSYTTETLTSDRYYRAAVTNGTCAVDYSAVVTVTHSSKPTTQASGISFSSVSGTGMTVNWTRGNGANVLVIARAGSAPTDPSDGTTYNANAAYGSGDAAGGGFVVYNGTGTNVNVTGLSGQTTYYFAVYEFNGACYHLTELTGNQTTAFEVPYCESWNGSVGIWTASSNTSYPLTYSTGTTPSTNTGPNTVQDGSHYVFVESSSSVAGDITYLTTSSMNLSPYTDLQAKFYYHMYGSNIGALSLEVSINGGSTYSTAWIKSGQLQTSNGEAWAHATVDLSSYAGNSDVVMRFKFDENGNAGINGDISIDNFCLTDVDFGTQSASTTICADATTNLTVSGHDGAATLQWEESSNGYSGWANVTGGSGATTDTYTTPTGGSTVYYRCKLTNGSDAYTDTIRVDRDATPVAGTSGGSTTICTGSTTGLTLSGYTGSIQWEESTNQSIWANETGGTGGTTDAYTTEALTSDRYYRAKVSNGACTSVYAANVTVTVDAAAVGGTGNGSTGICGATTSNLSVSGTTGSLQWQRSTDNATYNDIAGETGTTYTTTALAQTTYYRVKATNGVCTDYSSVITITYSSPSVGGTAAITDATTCKGNTQNLSLSGYTGSFQWQLSTDGGGTWNNVSGGTTTPFTVTIANANEEYRAQVTNGACSTVNSTTITVVGHECMSTAQTTLTSCASITMYDSGGDEAGSAGDYSPSEELIYTVCPDDPNTSRIVITMDVFNSASSADEMRIYNGDDVYDCKISTFSGYHGTGLAASPFQASQDNTSGCLTMFWISNSSTEESGWEATISCQAIGSAPAAYDCPPECDRNADQAGEDCANAPLVSSLDGYCGTTWDNSFPDPSGQPVPGGSYDYYTPDATPSDYGGSDAGISWNNSSYIKFIAGATSVDIDYWVDENPYYPAGCTTDGIQLRIHESPTGGCTGWNQTDEPSSGDWTINPTTTAHIGNGKGTWTVAGLTVGNTYYIAIDGYAGRTCQYAFAASSGVATCNVSIDSNTEVCNGDGTYNVEITYSGGAGAGATYYVDDADNGGVSNSGDNPNTTASGTIIMGPYYNGSPYNIELTGGNQTSEQCFLSVQGLTNGCGLTTCADADETDADGSISCGSSFNLSYTASATTVYTIDQTDCTPTLYPHTTGTQLSLGDDQVSTDLNIGFSFDFFGTTYAQFRVHSNGLISFGSETYTGFTQQTIPTASVDNFIAGCYRDLDPRATGSDIRYETIGSSPNRKLVVTFDNVGFYNQLTSTTTFQIVLEETTNCVKIHTIEYPDQNDSWTLDEATQGIQSGSNTFVPPGRNWEEWGGITSGDNDCVTLCPVTTGGCTFDHWEDDIGNNVGTSNPQSVSPGQTTTYYAVFDCSGTDCYQPQTVTVTGTCASCSQKDYIYAPDGGTTIGDAECTDGSGWTHYYSSSDPNNILFSIYKNGNDLTGTTVQIDVENGGTDYLSKSDTDYSTFLLRRAWRVLAAGPDYNAGTGALSNPVKIRFYYIPQEKTDVENAAYAMTTSGGGSHDSYEAFTWFKSNDGVSYAHEAASFTAVSVTNTYNLTVTSTGTTNTQNQTNYVQIDNITGFSGGSGFGGSEPAAVLPISLVEFHGTQKEEVNELYWKTASEINSDWFVVEKSTKPDTDFNQMIKVKALGNTSILNDYRVEDVSPYADTYYRLKMIDIDGSYKYNNVILVRRKSIDENTFRVYPNPANKYLNIELTGFEESSAIITLTDILGKQYFVNTFTYNKGRNIIEVDLTAFSIGIYYLSIEAGNDRLVKKVVKEN